MFGTVEESVSLLSYSTVSEMSFESLTFDRLRLEPLPDSYALDYPLLRQARGWRGDEEVRVWVYEDLVSASDRARQIKVYFALEQ